MTHARDWDDLADELGIAAVADGEPTRWYDELWSAAARGEVATALGPHRPAPSWPTGWPAGWPSTAPARAGRAVVVGCGLGADSEHLAAHGWRTVAFDISPAAVAAVRDRYPDSPVDYREGNLLDLGRPRRRLRPRGRDLHASRPCTPPCATGPWPASTADGPGRDGPVVQVVRRDGRPVTDEPPWTLTRDEVQAVASDDVHLDSLDEVLPPGRVNPLWRAVLTRR